MNIDIRILRRRVDGGHNRHTFPACQMNVEAYQNDINAKYKTKFNIPVTYYSTLMSVAYGGSAKDAGLDGQIIRAKQLEDIASK